MPRYKRTLLVLAAVIAASWLMLSLAHAQDDGKWLRQSLRASCHFWDNCPHRYRTWHTRAAWLRRHSSAWAREGETWRQGKQCYERVIEVLSGPHKDEDKALTEAWKRWMSEVQFERGSIYMEPENSVQRRWLCSIVDPGEGWFSGVSRVGGRIANIAGGKAPNASDGRSIRCKIWARPCREAPERPRGQEEGTRR